MTNLLIKLSIFYHFVFALVLIFVGLYQWHENDKIWPMVVIVAVALPMGFAQVIVLLHVLRAIPLAIQAEQDARLGMVHQFYPPSKGTPFVTRGAKKAGAAGSPVETSGEVGGGDGDKPPN
jgi:hypothetical protein